MAILSGILSSMYPHLDKRYHKLKEVEKLVSKTRDYMIDAAYMHGQADEALVNIDDRLRSLYFRI